MHCPGPAEKAQDFDFGRLHQRGGHPHRRPHPPGFRKFIPETTKIIIAQRVASVQDADRILLMKNGEIEAMGSHEELMASNPTYREIYTSQNRVNSQEKAGAENG